MTIQRIIFTLFLTILTAAQTAVAADVVPTQRQIFVEFLGGTFDPETYTPVTPKPAPIKKTVTYPFYISASNYMSQRGVRGVTQLKLTYKISASSANGELSIPASEAVLTLGSNFAVIERGKVTRIFDFKTGRLLTLKKDAENLIFDNLSLYVGAYKTIDTVSRVTKGGELSKIAVGPDSMLDSFWLESSLGWAARDSVDGLSVTRTGQNITASYGEQTALSMSLSGPEIPSEAHMRSFFAFLNHDAAIHPAILPQIGKPERAPKSMSILSYSPNFPNGLITNWKLISAETIKAPFPLPIDALTSLEASKSSDLAKTIAGAAQEESIKRRLSHDDLRQEFFNKREGGQNFEAWLTGMILADRLGGCAKDPGLLCEDLKTLEAGADLDSDLAKLPAILRLAQDKDSREAGLLALTPYIDDNIAPAFLVKFAGQARAKLKTTQSTDPAVKALSAPALLEEALGKDPYDANIYKLLAQVYASEGRFAESWDLQDAMRALPSHQKADSRQIRQAEKKIRLTAPGFFIKN